MRSRTGSYFCSLVPPALFVHEIDLLLHLRSPSWRSSTLFERKAWQVSVARTLLADGVRETFSWSVTSSSTRQHCSKTAFRSCRRSVPNHNSWVLSRNSTQPIRRRCKNRRQEENSLISRNHFSDGAPEFLAISSSPELVGLDFIEVSGIRTALQNLVTLPAATVANSLLGLS